MTKFLKKYLFHFTICKNQTSPLFTSTIENSKGEGRFPWRDSSIYTRVNRITVPAHTSPLNSKSTSYVLQKLSQTFYDNFWSSFGIFSIKIIYVSPNCIIKYNWIGTIFALTSFVSFLHYRYCWYDNFLLPKNISCQRVQNKSIYTPSIYNILRVKYLQIFELSL